MKPKVSVVIPYYNNEKTILRALKSVLDQEYTNLEIILIDDGSEDNSFKIVNDFIERYKIKDIINISQKNSGPSVARNRGIEMSTGEYIAFLDADDSWSSSKIKSQVNIVSEKNIDLLGCNFFISKENEVEKHYFLKEKLRKISFKELLYKHYYATPCVMVKKEVLEKVGMFDEKQRYMEDSLLFTRIARDFDAYMTNDFFVTTYKNSYGETGLSGNLKEMQKYELYNFKKLYKENDISQNKISLIEYFAINMFSIIKFLRRIFIVKLRKG